jgi:hypothetical protein
METERPWTSLTNLKQELYPQVYKDICDEVVVWFESGQHGKLAVISEIYTHCLSVLSGKFEPGKSLEPEP